MTTQPRTQLTDCTGAKKMIPRRRGVFTCPFPHDVSLTYQVSSGLLKHMRNHHAEDKQVIPFNSFVAIVPDWELIFISFSRFGDIQDQLEEGNEDNEDNDEDDDEKGSEDDDQVITESGEPESDQDYE